MSKPATIEHLLAILFLYPRIFLGFWKHIFVDETDYHFFGEVTEGVDSDEEVKSVAHSFHFRDSVIASYGGVSMTRCFDS